MSEKIDIIYTDGNMCKLTITLISGNRLKINKSKQGYKKRFLLFSEKIKKDLIENKKIQNSFRGFFTLENDIFKINMKNDSRTIIYEYFENFL